MTRYCLSMIFLSLLWLGRSPAGAAEPVKFPLMAWDYADDRATLTAMAECGITSVAFVPPKALDACKEGGWGGGI